MEWRDWSEFELIGMKTYNLLSRHLKNEFHSSIKRAINQSIHFISFIPSLLFNKAKKTSNPQRKSMKLIEVKWMRVRWPPAHNPQISLINLSFHLFNQQRPTLRCWWERKGRDEREEKRRKEIISFLYYYSKSIQQTKSIKRKLKFSFELSWWSWIGLLSSLLHFNQLTSFNQIINQIKLF